LLKCATLSEVWKVFRIVLAVLVQRSPGREGEPEIREIGDLWALEVTRSAVDTRARLRVPMGGSPEACAKGSFQRG